MIGVEISTGAREAYAGWMIGLLEIEGLIPRAERI